MAVIKLKRLFILISLVIIIFISALAGLIWYSVYSDGPQSWNPWINVYDAQSCHEKMGNAQCNIKNWGETQEVSLENTLQKNLGSSVTVQDIICEDHSRTSDKVSLISLHSKVKFGHVYHCWFKS